MASTWGKRASQGFDPATCHIDHGDRRHTHDGAFQHAMADGLTRILEARDAERTADVLTPRIAGDRLLRERLHRRLDGEIDGEADIGRSAIDIDAIRPVA